MLERRHYFPWLGWKYLHIILKLHPFTFLIHEPWVSPLPIPSAGQSGVGLYKPHSLCQPFKLDQPKNQCHVL